jgi:hypothetical protein
LFLKGIKARQEKHMDKAAKRIMAKQQKANQKTGTPNVELGMAEPILAEKIVRSTELPKRSSIKKAINHE